MELSLTDFILGKAFINELPEGAKRAIQIASYNPQLVHIIEETASFILTKIEEVDQIIIITGFPYKTTFETDGPIGAINLAEALMSLNKEVQLSAEVELLPIFQKMITDPPREGRLTFTPIETVAAVEDALLITVERPGENVQGRCHSMLGKNISPKVYPIEQLFQFIKPYAWVGIGDGGNELGLGRFKEAVEEKIAFGKECQCGCGGGIAAEKQAAKTVLAATSNFGALGLALEITKQAQNDWSYSTVKNSQTLKKLNLLGLVDGVTGGEGTVDSISPELSRKMIEQLIEKY
ncbi:MAG: glutamate cyclase domain-containing protein [Candidatus Kariarchaeaceae archaeon]